MAFSGLCPILYVHGSLRIVCTVSYFGASSDCSLVEKLEGGVGLSLSGLLNAAVDM